MGERNSRVGWDDQTKVHESTEEDLVVFEYIADVFETRLAFHG